MPTALRNPETARLDRVLASIHPLRALQRPPTGWLRAIREAAGVSAGELGRILGVSRQLPVQFERAEADDSITLKSLRAVAAALDCDLVYALLPRSGSLQALPEIQASAAESAAPPPSASAVRPPQSAPRSTPAFQDTHFCD